MSLFEPSAEPPSSVSDHAAFAFAQTWASVRTIETLRRVDVRYVAGPRAAAPPFSTWESIDVLTAVSRIIDGLGLDPGRLLARRLRTPEDDIAGRLKGSGELAILAANPTRAADGRGIELNARVVAIVVEGLDAMELMLGFAWHAEPQVERRP